jgi:hypothetical protein
MGALEGVMQLGRRLRALGVGIVLGCAACGGSGAANDPGAIAGTWVWFNTPTVYIDTNGDLRLPGTAPVGNWTSVDVASRAYQLAWANGYVDSLSLAEDGDSLDGHNQYGVRVTATRAR